MGTRGPFWGKTWSTRDRYMSLLTILASTWQGLFAKQPDIVNNWLENENYINVSWFVLAVFIFFILQMHLHIPCCIYFRPWIPWYVQHLWRPCKSVCVPSSLNLLNVFFGHDSYMKRCTNNFSFRYGLWEFLQLIFYFTYRFVHNVQQLLFTYPPNHVDENGSKSPSVKRVHIAPLVHILFILKSPFLVWRKTSPYCDWVWQVTFVSLE